MEYFVREKITQKLKTTQTIRADFKKDMNNGEFIRFFGVTSPIEAIIIQDMANKQGQKVGLYLSGAGLSTFHGVPDIGVLTLDQVEHAAREIAQMTDLPLLVDVDTGYGDVVETVKRLENAGVTLIHMEDQVFPKRCGHLDGKELVSSAEMEEKIKQAVQAREDENFLIMARSDAKGVEGMDGMLERLQNYIDAGADLAFPEAITSVDEFKIVKEKLNVPLLANLTENGKTPLGIEKELDALGYNIALYPVTLMRSHMAFVENAVVDILENGNEAYEQTVMARGRCMHHVGYDDYVNADHALEGHGIEIKK